MIVAVGPVNVPVKVGFAIGKNNATTDAAFVVGNGADSGNKSDALVINTDGSAVFSGDVTVNSDMRLKANIISLGSTLAKLLQIDGKSYVMKNEKSKKKIGLIAQEVELISELKHAVKQPSDENELYSLDYGQVTPFLISAIKELSTHNTELENRIAILEQN